MPIIGISFERNKENEMDSEKEGERERKSDTRTLLKGAKKES